MLRNNRSSIQEHLVNSLIALNDNGKLTDLIREVQKVKISREAEVFILITLCLDTYPELINHLERQSLEELYDACFLQTNAQELLDILEKPLNSKVKSLLYPYIKSLAEKQKKKNVSALQNLLEVFVQYNMDESENKTVTNVGQYLLDDYARFVENEQVNESVWTKRLF